MRCGGVAGGAAGRVLDAIGLEAAEAAVLPVLARLHVERPRAGERREAGGRHMAGVEPAV